MLRESHYYVVGEELEETPVALSHIQDSMVVYIIILLNCFWALPLEHVIYSITKMKCKTCPISKKKLRQKARSKWDNYFYVLVMAYSLIIRFWLYTPRANEVLLELTSIEPTRFQSPNGTCFLKVDYFVEVYCKYQGYFRTHKIKHQLVLIKNKLF